VDDGRACRHHLARLGRPRRHGARERRDDLKIVAIGPLLCELSARAVDIGLRGRDLPSRGRDRGGLGPLVVLGLSGLLLRDQLPLEERGERVAIPPGLRIGGFGLGELGLDRGQPRLGLSDHRLRLLLAGAHLLVVEDGDDGAGLDPIALAHGDLADPAARLRRDRGVVALDPPAHRDHAGAAKKRRQVANAASATTISSAAAMITRRRVRRPGGGAVSGPACSDGVGRGGSCRSGSAGLAVTMLSRRPVDVAPAAR